MRTFKGGLQRFDSSAAAPISIWSDSDWAMGSTYRKSYSGNELYLNNLLLGLLISNHLLPRLQLMLSTLLCRTPARTVRGFPSSLVSLCRSNSRCINTWTTKETCSWPTILSQTRDARTLTFGTTLYETITTRASSN